MHQFGTAHADRSLDGQEGHVGLVWSPALATLGEHVTQLLGHALTLVAAEAIDDATLHLYMESKHGNEIQQRVRARGTDM